MGMQVAKARRAEAVFSRVLSEVKPSAVEAAATVAGVNAVMHRLKGIVDRGVELKVVGSIARGTNLKGDSDVDIFVLFHKKTKQEELVRKGLAYGKRLASGPGDRYEIKYAEHPYIRLYLRELGVRIDLVPALRIGSIEEMGTTVDRTPLHADFINSSLSGRQRDEVRVLKQLLKAHHIYGAEVKIGGFTGYLCEILVYQYGSLLGLLEAAAAFAPPVVLDPKSRRRLSDQALVKRFNSSFIVIDPVDPGRNVAAGVSTESLARFVLVAREFVKEPSMRCFYGSGFPSPSARSLVARFLKESGLSLYLVSLKVPDKSEDVVWPQLRKMANMVAETAARYDYRVYLAIQWVSGTRGCMLFLAPSGGAGARLLRGPDVFMGQEATDAFLMEHRTAIGPIMKGSTVCMVERNRYKDMESLLSAFVSGRLIRGRKDVRMAGARLFVDRMPAGLSEEAYSEIKKHVAV